MSIILPSNYHSIQQIQQNSLIRCVSKNQLSNLDPSNPIKIGILNIMPLGHQYELNILNSLGFTNFNIEPIWLKLNSHDYKSWPPGYIEKFYISYEKAKNEIALDGLIITGTPLEHLDFEEVNYWNEIVGIINDARNSFPSTLGLCWAGMAMAYLLGVKKVVFQTKLFGVFELENKAPNHPIMGATDDKFFCPQSRYAGMDNKEIEKAENRGDLKLLAFGKEAGYPIYETPDHKQLIHLGHPEYNSSRLAYEAKRDSGNPNVPPISNFDYSKPKNVWKMHRHTFFQQWLNFCHEKSRLKI
ncbi:MAG: homoserine O-succinyltransferase [SAR202 cluster bacterium]|nr:homoserine O-succinyltransferase [SAR202 cluster bacterium]|tara:strand:+ start:20683 stop:21582 length:900 start_codon:yes stop_codon:yes gene_type:complete